MSAPTGEMLEKMRAKAQEDVRALRSRIDHLGDEEIDLILTNARSHYAWSDKPLHDEILYRLYEITASGPTSMNTCPARFIFVRSAEGKERLAKSLKPANVGKMMGAPVTVIIAHDLNFWTELPFLFPHKIADRISGAKSNTALTPPFEMARCRGGIL